MDEKYRHALTKFYEKYEPKKVKTVEALLEKYSGQEEELLFALAKKYDPERDAASIVDELLTEVSTPVGETQPSQAEDVEDNHADIADSFRESAIVAERKPLEAGKEELVMGSPNPRAPAENAYRKELIQLYEKYSPSRVANVDKELNKYSGREEALIAAVKKRYVHDEPPTEEENYRQKLLNLYNTFAPSKAHKVDFYLTKYRGREGSLLAAAEAKFLKQASDLHEAAEAARKEGDYHNRLKAVYEEYAPQRIPKVDHDLQKYPGREEEVIQAAIKKFGGAESDEGYPTENDDDEKKEEQAKPTVEVTPVEEHITHEEQPKPAVEVTPMEESAPHQESKTTVEVTPVEEQIGHEEPPKPAVEVTPAEENATHEEQPKPVVEVTPREESVPQQEPQPTAEATPVKESAPHEEPSKPAVEVTPVDDVRHEESKPVVDIAPEAPSAPAVEVTPVEESAAREEPSKPTVEITPAEETATHEESSKPTVEVKPVEDVPHQESNPTVKVTPVEEHITHEEPRKPAVELTPIEERTPRQEAKTTAKVTPAKEHSPPKQARGGSENRLVTVRDPVDYSNLDHPVVVAKYQLENTIVDYFGVLGTTVIANQNCIERSVCEVLWNNAGLDKKDMCSSDIITLRDFSASVLACTVPDITLMQRTVEKMLAFIKVCRDTLLKSSKAPKPSSTKSLQYGFWVHRSIHPSVMPSWKRSWAILTEENVLRLCVPNTTRSHMEFSFERIENCKLNAMQCNTGAPKPYRRNGVLIRITSDPEPLEVRLCTEVSEHAHALVKAYRNWKKVRENLLPSPSLSLAREKSVSMGATEVEVDTSDLSRVEVWCCPKQTYEHSVWSFAHGVLIHYSASNAQTTYMWNLEGVEEVTRIQSVPVLPPYPLRETLCFVIRRSGGKNIFCCTDSLRKTNYCIATLRQYLLRNQMLPNTAVALQYPIKVPGRYGRTGSCSTSRRSLNSSIASSISTPVARRYVENDAPSPIPLFPK